MLPASPHTPYYYIINGLFAAVSFAMSSVSTYTKKLQGILKGEKKKKLWRKEKSIRTRVIDGKNVRIIRPGISKPMISMLRALLNKIGSMKQMGYVSREMERIKKEC